MLFSFLYPISFTAFVVCLAFYPKIAGKLHLVTSVMFSYVTALCWGTLGAAALQVCGVPIGLAQMTMVYMAGVLLLLIALIRRRSLQKMTVRFFDIFVLAAGTVLIALFAVHMFSRHLYINYWNMVDPGRHYQWAMEVVREKKLSGMFFAPLHNGMFINMLLPFVPETWSYKLFILSDCFHTLMQSFFFYGLMLYICKESKYKWLPAALTVLYWFGYPFYSFGKGAYIYWAMGAMLVQYVILILKIYEDNSALRKWCIPLLILGAISVTVCYVQFAPAVFLAALAVIVYCGVLEKKIVWNKKLIIQAAAVCVFVGICALVGYDLIFYSRGKNLFEQFMLGSNTSKALELIIAVPIIYYLVYRQIREKRLNAYSIALLSFLAVQIAFTFLAALNLMSSYYLFKNYFIFWSLLWMILADQRQRFVGKIRTYTTHYLLIVLLVVMFAYVPQGQLETEDSYSLDNSIWRHNALLLKHDYRNPYLSKTKIELMEYICYNWDETDTKVSLLGTNTLKGVCSWYEGLTNQESYWLSPLNREDIEAYLEESGADYFAVFTDSEAYENNAAYLNSFEKVYENEEGFIASVHS